MVPVPLIDTDGYGIDLDNCSGTNTLDIASLSCLTGSREILLKNTNTRLTIRQGDTTIGTYTGTNNGRVLTLSASAGGAITVSTRNL